MQSQALQRTIRGLPPQHLAANENTVDQQAGVGRARLYAAIVAGIFGFLAMGFLGLKGLDFKEISHNEDFKFFIALLFARIMGSLTIGYLAYTLFGAAERLLLPYSLLRGTSSHVPIIRTILGVRSPLDAALKVKRNVLKVEKKPKFVSNSEGQKQDSKG